MRSWVLPPVPESQILPAEGRDVPAGAGMRVVGWGRANEGAAAMMEYPVRRALIARCTALRVRVEGLEELRMSR